MYSELVYSELVEIKHYPIGRWSLYRECIEKHLRTNCNHCGKHKGGKFVYYTWTDGVYTKPKMIKGDFCSKGCMAAYHNFWDR